MKKIAVLIFLILSISVSYANPQIPSSWPKETLMGVERLESSDGVFPACADILSCYFDTQTSRIRVRLPLMTNYITGENEFSANNVSLRIVLAFPGAQSDGSKTADGNSKIVIAVGHDGRTSAVDSRGNVVEIREILFLPEFGIYEAEVIPSAEAEGFGARPSVRIESFVDGEPADAAFFDPAFDPTYTTNCAFMHHGNQSLSYTDVFRGRWDDGYSGDASGFDEVLEVHQLYSIPGNFHISTTLISAAEWYDPDFNTWIANGVTAGWIEVNTSAYAQHIMPFVNDNMNDWSVIIEGDMIFDRYGFEPRVAWVPERVFLDGPGGAYPNAGVADYIADNFADNGVWAIILDDNIHLTGYDNHQIHYLNGSTLRLIPRDDDFTGKLHAGDGAGALSNLVGMANDASGPYRIAVYADDWEMAAEMGEWAGSMPNALDTYEWMIQQCNLESAWLSTWKLTDAVSDPDFNGVGVTPTYGTHGSIGGTDGYGGANNAWYTHWAGYASPSDHHSPQWNFGYIWSDVFSNLSTCPDNNTAQSAWYVLMSQLYETGWHDGMGGPISGWQMKHSTHIKNANVYAEASRWANGDLGTGISATYADWDHDGDNEIVIRNGRVLAVFEHNGARAHWIFGRGGGTGWEGSIAGNCVAYWEGTEGDYNDANHIAPLSDVSIGGNDYQHSLYASEILYSTTDSAEIRFTNYYVDKRIKVKAGEPYLRVYYDTGPDFAYIKSGFTPDLVDVLWNADMNRLWSAGNYCGYHNPNTKATAAIIMGNGGANHSTDFQSTILKGDEVSGAGGFGFLIFAGELADVAGMTSPTLNSLAGGVSDIYPPKAYYASYHPGTGVMEIAFGDTVKYTPVTMTNIGIDRNGNGTSDVTLDGACTVINTAHSKIIRITLSSAKKAAVDALVMTTPYLWLSSSAFRDLRDNPNATQTATIGDGVQLNVLPATSITIDGYIDPTEWVSATHVIDDPDDDSEWGTANELYDLYLFWDDTYLYIGLHGTKESARSMIVNSWLIYLDTDWGGPNGEDDLTEIDTWDRNAEFSGGFRADIQYGSWGTMDGDVWDITSATTSVHITDGVIVNTDLTAARPGSEIAISWDAIYGLGEGFVDPMANIAVCASIAGSSDDSDLGGDCIPNQASASFPVLDSFYVQVIDSDGDGLPDDFFEVVGVRENFPGLPESEKIFARPNPFNSVVEIINPSGKNGTAEIYDIKGRMVDSIELKNGTGIWEPSENISTGIYLVKLEKGEIITKVTYLK